MVTAILVGAGVMLVVLALILRGSYRAVPPGKALVIQRMNGEPVVATSGRLIVPIVQHAEELDLSVRELTVHRSGKEGAICADNIRADVKVSFFLRVSPATEDVLRVARSIGCARASQPGALEELFAGKFAEAIKIVARQFELEQLYTRRDEFRDKVIEVIGRDLHGFVLDDAVVDYLEQTPIEVLDPNNMLDALAIRNITRITHGVAAPSKNVKLRKGEKLAALEDELEELGALDVRVACEVNCDIATERPLLAVKLDEEDSFSRLPESVPRAYLRAIGRAEVTCADGRATVRWDGHAERDQLLAGARVVHALRDADRGYR